MSSDTVATAAFVVSVIALVASIASVWYTRSTAHSEKRQADAAERALELSTQPLLSIERVEIDQFPDDEGILFQAWIRNRGRPAHDVHLVAVKNGAAVARSRHQLNIGTGQEVELRVVVPREHSLTGLSTMWTGLVATDGEFEARWAPRM